MYYMQWKYNSMFFIMFILSLFGIPWLALYSEICIQKTPQRPTNQSLVHIHQWFLYTKFHDPACIFPLAASFLVALIRSVASIKFHTTK